MGRHSSRILSPVLALCVLVAGVLAVGFALRDDGTETSEVEAGGPSEPLAPRVAPEIADTDTDAGTDTDAAVAPIEAESSSLATRPAHLRALPGHLSGRPASGPAPAIITPLAAAGADGNGGGSGSSGAGPKLLPAATPDSGSGGSSSTPSGSSSDSDSDSGSDSDGDSDPPPEPAPPPPPPDPSPAPPPGSFVTPGSVGGSVGVGSTSAVHDGHLDLSTPGQVLENTVVNGCVTVEADNVTIRNVLINCNAAGAYPILDDANTGTRVERTTIDCLGVTHKGMYFRNSNGFGVDRVHITGCDDQFFIDGGLGYSWITNSVFHNQAPSGDAHTDGMQVGTFNNTTGTLVIDGNWWEYNRSGCCDNGVLFLSSQANLTVEIRDNFLDHDFGTHILRCRPGSNCIVENNTLGGTPDGLFFYSADGGPGTSRCNRFSDGTLIGPNLHSDTINLDNSSC